MLEIGVFIWMDVLFLVLIEFGVEDVVESCG